MRETSRKIRSRVIDVVCGLLAYLVARLVWSAREVLDNLLWELLTFLGVYVLLQTIARGWRLARQGRRA